MERVTIAMAVPIPVALGVVLIMAIFLTSRS
jgi:hypothetical protein